MRRRSNERGVFSKGEFGLDLILLCVCLMHPSTHFSAAKLSFDGRCISFGSMSIISHDLGRSSTQW